MCWSANISLLACAVQLSAAYVSHGNFRRFYLYYAVMELLQATQWLTLHLPTINWLLTNVAYLLVWAQLWLWWSFVPRPTRTLTFVISFITGIALLMLLLANEPTYFLPDTNFGANTCTFVGHYGHLAWVWRVRSIQYHPMHFGYLLGILAACVEMVDRQLYETNHDLDLVGTWGLTLVWSIYRVGTGSELPAYWCFVSFFGIIVHLGRSCQRYLLA